MENNQWRITSTESTSYETWLGIKQIKTETTVYANNNKGICEIINWGSKGDNSVRFFKGSSKLKSEYMSSFGSYDAALKACELWFNSLA